MPSAAAAAMAALLALHASALAQPAGPHNTPETAWTFNWTVKASMVNLDGALREAITINGRVPGPPIEVDVGTCVLICPSPRVAFLSLPFFPLVQQSPDSGENKKRLAG